LRTGFIHNINRNRSKKMSQTFQVQYVVDNLVGVRGKKGGTTKDD